MKILQRLKFFYFHARLGFMYNIAFFMLKTILADRGKGWAFPVGCVSVPLRM